MIVSAILPVFNGEKYIFQAIKSVLNQTFKDFELIIIDDASIDNTLKIIHEFGDPRIRVKKLGFNRGPSAARNIGLQEARGKWIAFIDADDVWHKERLKKLLLTANSYPHAFIGSDVMLSFSGKDNELIPWKSKLREQNISTNFVTFPKPCDLIKSRFDVKPILPTGILRKFSLEFNEKFRGNEWLEIMLKLYRAGLYLIIVNEPLYYQRIAPGSLSSSYRGILDELKMSEYLQSLDWIDESVKNVLYEKRKITKYRLLTTAIRDGLWIEALSHIFYSPNSLLYLLRRCPNYILQKFQEKKLYKRHINRHINK
ncbi:MAG: glycosyltransferase [Candidatus Aminicenantes bacterium]|nr:glycosyltransferase [Candidatus Aminicenantes bacterium]